MSGYGIKNIFSPSRVIFFSLIAMVLLGTCTLLLSCAHLGTLSIIDAFFTATSALCVTGLTTVPLTVFTPFGKGIILVLIQIGGLGIITLTLFVVSLVLNLGMGTKIMAEELLDVDTWDNTKKLLIFIIITTFIFEGLGFLILFNSLKVHFPCATALGYALFQSISAFCNSGISLFGPEHTNLIQETFMCSVMGTLMILGGIGFLTLKEILKRINPFSTKPRKICFSLQTKICLFYYTGLTIITTFFFWIIEKSHALKSFSFLQQAKISLFTAITSRSGGFLLLDPTQLQPQSFLLLIINGFIGAAPASTGSGIKLTTFAILITATYAVMQLQEDVEMNGRTFAKDQLLKALAVLVLSIGWIIFSTFCLMITDPHHSFLSIIVETTSAFTTLGISTGITPLLSESGKCIIALTIFLGRISPLTMLLALRFGNKQHEFSYPEERVMIS